MFMTKSHLEQFVVCLIFSFFIPLSSFAVIHGKAVQNANPDNVFCIGDTVHVSIDTAWTSANSYLWEICLLGGCLNDGADGGGWSVISGATNDSLDFVLTASLPASVRFRCKQTDNSPPGYFYTSMLDIVLEHPVATILPPAINTVCVSELVLFNSTFFVNGTTLSDAPTYNWFLGLSNTSSGSGETFSNAFVNTNTTNIKLIATSEFGCKDTTVVSVTAVAPPTANAGTDVFICNTENAPMSGTAGGTFTSIEWTFPNGTGTMTNANNLTTATFNPSAASGSVIITLEVTSLACPLVTDEMSVVVIAPPTANAGTGIHICNNLLAQLNGSVGGGANTGFTWTAPVNSGVFENETSLSTATFDPLTNNGEVLLTLEVTSAFCELVTDTMTVYVIPPPLVNAGIGQHVCSADNADLDGSVTIGPISGSVWSAPNGTGTFTNASSPGNATFNPSSDNGSVLLTLTAASDYCAAVSDTMTIYIDTSPEMILTPDTICSGTNATITPSSNLGNGLDFEWTASTSDDIDFGPSSGIGSINQTITNNDITDGVVTYTYTPTSAENCPGTPASVDVIVIASPTVTAFSTTDDELCEGEDLIVNLQFTGNGDFAFEITNSENEVFSSTTNLNSSTFTITPSLSTTYDIILLTGSGDFACPTIALGSPLEVIVHPTPQVSVSVENDTFCSNAGAEVSVSIAQGNGPFSGEINVSAEGDFSFSNAPSPVIISFDVSEGTNTISLTQLTDAFGCSPVLAEVNTVDIIVMPAPVATISSAPAILCGNEDLLMEVSGSLNGVITYSFNNQPDQTVQLTSSPTTVNLGQFTVGSTVSIELSQADVTINSVTCTSTLNVDEAVQIVAYPNTSSISIDTTSSPFCQGSQDLEISVSADLNGVTWSWSSIPFLPIAFNEDQTNAFIDIPENLTGMIVINATATMMVGSHACHSVVTESVQINTSDAPDPSQIILYPLNSTLVALTTDPLVNFQWGTTDIETYLATVATGETAQDWIVGTIDPDNYYWVMLTDESTGCSTISYYNNSSPIGVEEAQNVTLAIFPNPASELLYIVSEDNKEIDQIRIFDASGKIIYDHTFLNQKQIQIDVNRFSTGNYTMVIKTTEQLWSVSRFQIVSQN